MDNRSASSSEDDHNAGDLPPSLIARIVPQRFTAMDAGNAAFMAQFIPRLEREANRSWRTDVALTRDLLLHHFNQTASAVLDVCVTVEEFEEALYNDIVWFTRCAMTHCPFVAEPQQEEWSQGLLLYWSRANPIPRIPDNDRETIWHVGAITAEALCHAALKWRAEAWRRAAAGQLAETDNQATEGGERTPTDGKANSPDAVVGPPLEVLTVGRKKRLAATVTSPSAARRMETYMESKPIGQTAFAGQVGTTDRTLRRFRRTGKVRRDIFDDIAKAMGMSSEELKNPEKSE
jgi:hypothetical protein